MVVIDSSVISMFLNVRNIEWIEINNIKNVIIVMKISISGCVVDIWLLKFLIRVVGLLMFICVVLVIWGSWVCI